MLILAQNLSDLPLAAHFTKMANRQEWCYWNQEKKIESTIKCLKILLNYHNVCPSMVVPLVTLHSTA